MLHKEVLADKPKEAGRYRTATDKIEIHKKTFSPCEAWQIEYKILDLIDFINNKRLWKNKFKLLFLNKIEKNTFTDKQYEILRKVFMAWYIHHQFVAIHPFTDGNGRTARLLMCLILRSEDLSEKSFPILINFIIKDNRCQYLDCLNASDSNDFIPAVKFMTRVMTTAYYETAKIIKILKSKNKF